MRKWITWRSLVAGTAIGIGLTGCATKQREGLRGVQAEKAHEIVLVKPVHFAAIAVGSGSTVWYHGLSPGRYVVEATDDTGDYYAGAGQLLILGASRSADGEVSEPRTPGGFWLARNPFAQPAFKLYEVNPKNADGSERPMSWHMGVIPYAIDLMTDNRIGIGTWSWRFVPMINREDDLDRLIDAARPPK